MKWYHLTILIVLLILILVLIFKKNNKDRPPKETTIYDVLMGAIGLGGQVLDIFTNNDNDENNNN